MKNSNIRSSAVCGIAHGCRVTVTVWGLGADTPVMSSHTGLKSPPATSMLLTTSVLVSGEPSCHTALGCRVKVMLWAPTVQLLAISG